LHIPRQFFLVPFGPGEPKQITQDAIDHSNARFLPDGKSIVFTGTDPGHKDRIYVQEIGSNSPHAISPEGVTGVFPTADGKFIFGFSDAVALYPVDGQGTPHPASGIHTNDHIVSVLRDGHSVLVRSLASNPYDVFRVDLASGRRELFKKLGPADPTGVSPFSNIVFTPDGNCYAYGYLRILSELYTVDGLR
jgi:hypothetical protein